MKKDLKNSIRNLKRNKDYVGADDPVCPIPKRNTQRGITLVALIITIIVLLILAMVSIKIAIDGGLITKAKDAKDTHTIGTEKETISLAYGTYQIENVKKKNSYTMQKALDDQGATEIATVSGEDWNIKFTKTGNEYKLAKNGTITGITDTGETNVPTEDLAYLIKELIGENGKIITEIAEYSGSSQDVYNINFNNKKIHFITRTAYCSYAIEYNNNMYNLVLTFKNEPTTQSVDYIMTSTGIQEKEGKKVDYSYDGTEANKKEWTVLYDNGDTLEIISPEAIGSLTLGTNDTEAQGNNDFEKAVYSYNHAIDRINNYTASLVTNLNKISVRSVGSNPSNPNSRNTEKYMSIIEEADNNRNQDLLKMYNLGILYPESGYWLASRFVEKEKDVSNMGVCYTCNNNTYNSIVWYYSNSNSSTGYSLTRPVRPVVKVNASSVQIKD